MRPRPKNLGFLGLLGASLAVIAACSSSGGGPVTSELENVQLEPAPTPTAPAPPSPGDLTALMAAVVKPVATQVSATSIHDGRVVPPDPKPTPALPAPQTAPGESQGPDGDRAGQLDDPEEDPGEDDFDPWRFVSGRTCGDGPLLSAFPMDLENVTNINPLGNLGPPSHTFPTSHMYFGIETVWVEVGEGPFGDGQTFPPNPVYAVADSQLVSISVSNVTTSLSGQEVSYVEYGFDIAVCEGLRVRYGHVGPVSGRILSALADLTGFNCNNYSTGAFALESCTYAPGLELSAGEQVGFNSGRAAALDIGAFDIATVSNDFLHPELYGQEATGTVCLLDLYPADQRSMLARLLGDSTSLRTADPICGVLDYTVPGTLQGDWFNELGRFTQEDRNIAFVYDEILPDVPVISIGFVPGIRSLAYRFEPRDEGRVNRLFTDIETSAGVFCYQDFQDNWGNPGPATHLLVEVPDDGRLLVRAEDGADCGTSPWQIGADGTEFVR